MLKEELSNSTDNSERGLVYRELTCISVGAGVFLLRKHKASTCRGYTEICVETVTAKAASILRQVSRARLENKYISVKVQAPTEMNRS